MLKYATFGALLAALPLTPALAASAADVQLAQRIDSAIAPYYTANQPGATVIVTRDGKTLFRKAYGMADLAKGEAMREDMVMRIGSLTKQFTAAAILMLAEEGKLSLDDDITRHLPGYPTQGKAITIEHLLTHTSGIRSYTAMHDFRDRMHEDASVQAMIDYFKNEPADFAPGTRWTYSNSGYFLLGAIIEKVSGKPYPQFIAERIFSPLGMASSAYEGKEAGALRYATGYAQAGGKLAPSAPLSPTKTYAGGALVSTVDDLARWDAAIAGGKLLKATSWQRAFTPYRLTDGRSTNYGYGWENGKLQGEPMLAHGGNTNGFSTYAMRAPGQRLYVAVLSNAEYGVVQPDVVATRAAAIAIGKPLPEFREVAVDAKALEAYTGMYGSEGAAPRMFVVANGKLVLKRQDRPGIPLLAHAQDAFFIDKSLTHLAFGRDAQGKVNQVTIHQDGMPTVLPRTGDLPAERKAVVLDGALLDTYAGSYQMAPGFVLEVRRDGEQLVGQATGQPPLNLLASGEGAFFVKQIDSASVRFEKGADGKVDKLVWTQKGRARAAPRIN